MRMFLIGMLIVAVVSVAAAQKASRGLSGIMRCGQGGFSLNSMGTTNHSMTVGDDYYSWDPQPVSSQFSLEYGSITANNTGTSLRDVTQSYVGVRFINEEMDMGVMVTSAGFFFDPEYYMSTDSRLGSGWIEAALVVGIPVALMGNPLWISGWDVTLGGGLEFSEPIGPVLLDLRGEALFNFADWIIKLDSDVDPRAEQVVLLTRYRAGVWFSLGNSLQLEIGVRHDFFHSWRTTSGVVAIAF